MWLDLPKEIKENILKWLSLRDLKSCCLLDKDTCSTATRLLFRMVHISPNLNSIDRLTNIAGRPHLANLVRFINVHTHYIVDQPFERLIREGRLADRLQGLQALDAAAEVLKLEWAYKSEVASERNFLTTGPMELASALQKFPRLQGFIHQRPTARSATGDYLLDDDSDLLRRTGIDRLDSLKQFPLMNSVLQKSRHLRPTSIDLTSLYWWEFYNICQIPHLTDLFSEVTHFKLTFHVESLDRPHCRLTRTNSYWQNGLVRHLEQLVNFLPAVRNLWLGFDAMTSDDNAPPTVRRYASRKIANLLLGSKSRRLLYPNLDNLILENMTATIEELRNFIFGRERKLKTLSVINMRLIEHVGHEYTDIELLQSMIRVATCLHRSPQLDRVSLQDPSVDGSMATLNSCRKGIQGILYQVEELICHRQDSQSYLRLVAMSD